MQQSWMWSHKIIQDISILSTLPLQVKVSVANEGIKKEKTWASNLYRQFAL